MSPGPSLHMRYACLMACRLSPVLCVTTHLGMFPPAYKPSWWMYWTECRWSVAGHVATSQIAALGIVKALFP